MSTPFYVSPEQWYQDKAEYARKGIARGRPIVALEYDTGIVMMAENRSATLRKISEIYDRIAFGGVGKLDEYETLRKVRRALRRHARLLVLARGRGGQEPGERVLERARRRSSRAR